MRKLPVLPAFTHAVTSTANNLAFAFHASWPWLLFLVPLNMWAENTLLKMPPPTDGGSPTPEAMQAALIFYVITFASMVIYSSVAVSWHRYILKDDVPQGMQRMRLDSVVWRYVGNTFLVGLMVMLLILPIGLLLGIIAVIVGGVSVLMTVTAVAVMLMVAIPVSYRLSLKLPAIAVGNQTFKFGDGWNATRSNMLQLMFLAILSFGCVLALGFVLDLIQTAAVGIVGDTIGLAFRAVRQVGNWVLAIFTITLLTSLYGFFVEGRKF